jgi:hypothetical protein
VNDTSDVVVGVRQITSATRQNVTVPVASVQVHWVTVNGVEVPGHLMSVEWGQDSLGGMNIATIRIAAGSFSTVSHDGPLAPARFRRASNGIDPKKIVRCTEPTEVSP